MSPWIGDADATKYNAHYLTNLAHPLIKRELEQYRKVLGLTCDAGLNERQRRNFDRAMVAKYAEKFPPPGRAPWLLKIWDMLEQQTERGA